MDAIRTTAVFLFLALLLGAPFAALYAVVEGPLGIGALVGYMFSPLAASVILSRRAGVPLTEGLALRPQRSWAWLAAFAVPVGVALASLPASLLMPGITLSTDFSGLLEMVPPEQQALAREQLAALPSPWILLPAMLVQGVVAGATINAVAAFGEEAGWRGWLHRELAPVGFWRRAALVGVAWGLWHAPIILQGYNYPEHPGVGVGFMVLLCLGLSPVAHWIADRTASSLGAAVFHGTFNALASLPILYLAGGTDLTRGTLGVGGLAVLAVVNATLWAVADVEPAES